MLPRRSAGAWYPASVLLLVLAGWSHIRTGTAHPCGPEPPGMGVLIPWYIGPWETAAYSKLASYGSSCSIFAIVIGDSSGPPTNSFSLYTTAFKTLYDSGVQLFGYVHTMADFGASKARPQADVIAEVNSWFDNFGSLLLGIFFDEVVANTVNVNAVTYYGALANAVYSRNSSARVVFNPGTKIGCTLAGLSDVYVRYENYASAWAGDYAAGAICDCPTQSSCAMMLHAASRSFSYIYVTDDVMPNPWDTLATYFDTFMGIVAPAAPSSSPPPPLPSSPSSIWRPSGVLRWQWQLSGSDFRPMLRTRPQVIDVDLDMVSTLLSQAAELGITRSSYKLICYFSVGTYEPARVSADSQRGISWSALEQQLGGSAVPGPLYLAYMEPPFSEERWFALDRNDTRNALVNQVMIPRMRSAVAAGCDGIEMDNVDTYDNVPVAAGKRGVTQAQQLAYNAALLDAAHGMRLSAGLKNALDLLSQTFANGRAVATEYDWFLNERCWEYDECDYYGRNIKWDAVVFGVEYCDSRKMFGTGSRNLRPECVCPLANGPTPGAATTPRPTLNWLIKNVNLNAVGFDCREYCARPGVTCTAPAGGNVGLCAMNSPNNICPLYNVSR
ncbi:hypothetical protein VOLCADRAFT_120411 [Volvox carteri f. nagariensis]|uniref:Glycoside-hydrolase family GH114 TIM-barrel domain-containing protein n=1 Tax=Volvox carteri f. nagariensis TaxID=3068 RepID=D8TKF9_VOLCA|nr:uncharacterized protein VOLCADRAFT_120411 [Volvox carteri f. nagariensis]EFJ52241.1 hypothetical protein VOLCADRAFT_120411 [Volvox carteri f. nagariensis]|eukprot:XP_002947015.1 hypothetical protein VOLCADRAFT_120411 [Volvox carteri f. nagariensis]